MSYSRTQNPSFSRTRRGRGNTAAVSTRGSSAAADTADVSRERSASASRGRSASAYRGRSAAAYRGNISGIGRAMNPPVSQSSPGSSDYDGSQHTEDLNADRFVEGEGRSSEGREAGIHDDDRGRGRETERKMQSQGTHYSKAPDPSRNSKLKRNAEEEEERYKEYKEMKRERTAQELTHQPPKVVGGTAFSAKERDELRKKQEVRQNNEARFAAVRSRQKREGYRQKEREREDEEIRQRKAIQREKAVRAEARKREQAEVNLEELRRKRLEHFT